ncbi:MULTISPECIES: hypothetical protein [Fictibacillus]|uniref:Uncharacterized protein n=1 Tax=Fictibacillus terranigra TaxID=3058424 RepID=A0ABT8E1S3_9BACL|nr:hypothetical protein [Fictibacillus sp. CENA-BCM004]MDN4071867.1 hypothetical protein [Fictibacillus sp. CENA-BCM004]
MKSCTEESSAEQTKQIILRGVNMKKMTSALVGIALAGALLIGGYIADHSAVTNAEHGKTFSTTNG